MATRLVRIIGGIPARCIRRKNASDCGKRSPAAERYNRVPPEYPEVLFDISSRWPAWRPAITCSRWGARPARHPPAGPARFPVTCVELGAELPRPPPESGRIPVEVVRDQFEDWSPPEPVSRCTRLPPGTGSTQRSLPAGLAGAASGRAPGRCGRPTTCPDDGDPFSVRPGHLRRDRRGSAAGHPVPVSRRACRRPGRNRGQRALRGHRRPPVRLGARLSGRGVIELLSTFSGTWPWRIGNAAADGGIRRRLACAATTRCGGTGARC